MMNDRRPIVALIPNWIGDAAMCVPALRALARKYPENPLVLCGRKAPCALLHGLSYVAAQHVVSDHAGLNTMWSLRSEAGALAVVVFPHSFRAALLAHAFRPDRVIGYDQGGRKLLLTDPVPPHREDGRITPIYMVTEYINLVRILGCEDDEAGLELAVDPASRDSIGARFPGAGPLIGIAPAAAYGPSKLWPAERFAAVADALREKASARCVLITGPGEEKIRDAVQAAAAQPLLLADDGSSSIEKLKAVISQLDLLIGNDSGTRHIAVAFRVPTVCIMGPTSPAYSQGPYERGAVLRVDVDCGPCQKPVCQTDHRCMTRISVDWVLDTALDTLKTCVRKGLDEAAST